MNNILMKNLNIIKNVIKKKQILIIKFIILSTLYWQNAGLNV